MSARKFIVGNWKMNGLAASLTEARGVAEGLSTKMSDDIHVALCPPATLISRMASDLAGTRVSIGGQDCHAKASGAHTGDVSAQMLKDAGATYVIVGHSERRADHSESNDIVAAKAAAGIEAGLMTIICVGESEAQRDAGQAEAVVLNQVAHSIPGGAKADQFMIAYEPVWAIGTGRTPVNADIQAMHQAIRKSLTDRFGDTAGAGIAILYGGSVNPKNAAEILSIANVDGALVGGASLTAANFLGILNTQL
jgi:triosephosphate isomerase (TIM)